MKQITNDPEPCRLRNLGGSEMGTCDCTGVNNDCPNPPKFTAMAMLGSHIIDQHLAKVEDNAKDS